MAGVPELKGQAAKAVRHRGGNVQIIASAGSGKTEVVSQRIVSLLAGGELPESIVAFTFTEKAAASLAERVQDRVVQRLGEQALGKLGPLYIGTIHAFCFRLLQQHVPRYETYDALDERRLAAFLAREGNRLQIKQLDQKGRLFEAIKLFLANVEVVENELIRPDQLEDPFKGIYESYLQRLEDYRALTFGRLIYEAVRELEDDCVREPVTAPLKHLIVDEYQDVNPAQERLIELIARNGVDLCVVGDDDQAIYQWRGTDVGNITSFADRYDNTATFNLEVNRRSRTGVVEAANRCSAKIEGRLEKTMTHCREDDDHTVVLWHAKDEASQAQAIAEAIERAHASGHRYRDFAVLIRGRSSLLEILHALLGAGIPVLPGGRTNLFLQDDAQTFGKLCAWLAGHNWRSEPYGWGKPVTLTSLMRTLTASFGLDGAARKNVERKLQAWQQEAQQPTGPSSLVHDFYELLQLLGVGDWDHDDEATVTRLGTLARCTEILADFESMRFRARRDPKHPGEIVGGQDRGEWHYKWLASYVQNYALGAYEDFDGEDTLAIDAVELTTIHKAKGLEWPIVFVPSVISGRFPSSRTGRPRTEWHVSPALFDEQRYNGSLNDERRLFYVALTRARDQVLVSFFDSHKKGGATKGSPLLSEVFEEQEPLPPCEIPLPPTPEQRDEDEPIVEVTLSDLLLYDTCGMSFRLRSLLGFQPILARELGYGRAVHHILRLVAEHVQRHGSPPSDADLVAMFDNDFYMPLATKPMHKELKERAITLVRRFTADHADELGKSWAVERPFQLRTSAALVSGRADVILSEDDKAPSQLTIVDYKTASEHDDEQGTSRFAFQLQIYGDAGIQEGLDVAGAYVHDLVNNERIPVSVSSPALLDARVRLDGLIAGLRSSRYSATPGRHCSRCDVAPICRHRAR